MKGFRLLYVFDDPRIPAVALVETPGLIEVIAYNETPYRPARKTALST